MYQVRASGFGGSMRRLLFYAIVVVIGLLFLFPFFWLISSSFKTDLEVFRTPPVWWPETMHWDNYVRAVTLFPFPLYLRNTLLICLTTVIGSVVSCSLAAYSFACVDWPGRDAVFFLVITTMMIPYAVIMVPIFIIFRQIGWTGTYLPLIVPAFLAQNAFYVFLLRQFLKTLPLELFDAARVDGAHELFIYGRIVLPLCRPAVAVVALFQFMGSWNDFMGPLIYLNRVDQYTLSLGLNNAMQTRWADWSGLMAASLLTTLPLVVLYFFAQRVFVQGITLSGMKV